MSFHSARPERVCRGLSPVMACAHVVGAGLLIGEVRLELVCEDGDVDAVTALIRTHGRIGPQISGWIYVGPIKQSLPIGGDPHHV